MDALLRIKAQVSGIGDLGKLTRGLLDVQSAASSGGKGLRGLIGSMSGLAGSGFAFAGISAAVVGVGAAMFAASQQAIEFETSMSDVRKVVAGIETPKALTEIKNEILDLSSKMPITAKGFTEIYAAAGATGMARNQLREFSVLVAKVSTAFDMTAQEAGTALSQIRVALDLTTKEMAALADSMNYVSNTSGTSAAALVEFMTRSGATGKIAGLSAQETMAFGAAMQRTGVQTEVAATSFNNMIKALSAGTSMTDRQVSALDRLGYAFKPAIIGERDFSQEVEEQSRKRVEIARDETEKLIRQIDDRYARVKQTLQDQWEDERDSRERAINAAADQEARALQQRESAARRGLSDYYEDQQRIEEQGIRDRYKALTRTATDENRDMLDRRMDDELNAVRRRYRDIQEIETQKLEEGFDSQRKTIQEGLDDRRKIESRAARDREQAAIREIEAKEQSEQESIKKQQEAYQKAEKDKLEIFKKNQQLIKEEQKKQAEAAADAWKLGFSERLQNEGSSFLVEIIGKIGKLPAAEQASVMRDLFGDEARGLPSLIANVSALEEVLNRSTDATAAANSVNKEYELRASTTANQINLLVNDLYRLRVVIGEVLKPIVDTAVPALRTLTGGLIGLKEVVAGIFLAVSAVTGIAFVQWIASIGQALGVLNLGAVIAGWAGAIGPAMAAISAAFTGLLGFLTSTIGPALIAFFSGPVGWTVLAVAAVVAMAIAFREPIINFLLWIGENMASGFAQAWDLVKNVTNMFGAWFNNAMVFIARTAWALIDTLLVQPFIFAFNEVIRKPVVLFAQWLVSKWKELIDAFNVYFIKPLVFAFDVVVRQPITRMATWVLEKWQEIAKAFTDYLVKPIIKAWETVTTFLPKAMQKAADAIGSVWRKTVEGLRSFARGILNPIIDAVNQMLGGINDTIAAFNSLKGSDLPFAPVPNIPRFATGGYVTRPTLAMIGEGGEPEHVVPRSKVVSFSRAILSGATGASALSGGTSMRRTSGGAAAMIRQGGGGSRNITLNTHVDKVIRQDDEDKVTFAQAQALALDAARQAVAQIDGKLSSISYRQKLGIR